MKTIAINKALYDELVDVMKWYNAMPYTPHFSAGDRFHENVFDFQHVCVEDFEPEDGQYVSHFELRGDDVIMFVGFDAPPTTKEEFIEYKVVPQGDNE